jgi:hypothetical protein
MNPPKFIALKIEFDFDTNTKYKKKMSFSRRSSESIKNDDELTGDESE